MAAGWSRPDALRAMFALYALLGDKGEALTWFERAVELGNENFRWFERDPNWTEHIPTDLADPASVQLPKLVVASAVWFAYAAVLVQRLRQHARGEDLARQAGAGDHGDQEEASGHMHYRQQDDHATQALARLTFLSNSASAFPQGIRTDGAEGGT